MEAILDLEKVTKRYGRATAVDGLSLSLLKGELFTLLGPSGCGKTTTLRLIAGLESPDSGRIVCGGQTFASPEQQLFVPPERRRIGMVFQSLALWPHMTVFENLAYPLRLRGLPPDTIDKKVRTAVEMIGLGGFEPRLPATLSGGQQQRVAVARALIYEPDVVLMDEPFSSVDPTLRRHMRSELRGFLHRLGFSAIVVTHDQEEAFAMSDRVAIMNAGRLEQVGTPADVFDHPCNAFVREFLNKGADV